MYNKVLDAIEKDRTPQIKSLTAKCFNTELFNAEDMERVKKRLYVM
jgi:hypothetical protein